MITAIPDLYVSPNPGVAEDSADPVRIMVCRSLRIGAAGRLFRNREDCVYRAFHSQVPDPCGTGILQGSQGAVLLFFCKHAYQTADSCRLDIPTAGFTPGKTDRKCFCIFACYVYRNIFQPSLASAAEKADPV